MQGTRLQCRHSPSGSCTSGSWMTSSRVDSWGICRDWLSRERLAGRPLAASCAATGSAAARFLHTQQAAGATWVSPGYMSSGHCPRTSAPTLRRTWSFYEGSQRLARLIPPHADVAAAELAHLFSSSSTSDPFRWSKCSSSRIRSMGSTRGYTWTGRHAAGCAPHGRYMQTPQVWGGTCSQAHSCRLASSCVPPGLAAAPVLPQHGAWQGGWHLPVL